MKMVTKRHLPERSNPLIKPANSPDIEVLVGRRRLGQTHLQVKQGTAGLADASKQQNLGLFDYAHLRVPLPKDLSGSGIFSLKNANGGSYPESYFLMRRSSDGYISATGMFKAAFPWAEAKEEEAERHYHKNLSLAGLEEIAGSIWIAPEEALILGEQYGMRTWIEALLDPTPIEKGSKDKDNKASPRIQMPPEFDTSKLSSPPVVLAPSSTLRSTRARSTRSASPSKVATTPRKMATPRKSRAARAAKAGSVSATNPEELLDRAAADAVSSALQNSIEDGATPVESIASQSANGDVKDPETVRIEIRETIEDTGDAEVTKTNVKVDVPADYPALSEPEDPAKMIAEARKMVEAANKLENKFENTVVKAEKRKADDEIEAGGSSLQRPAKLARTKSTVEQKLAKEKVTRRALVGLTVMAAVGSAIGYLSGLA
ncbi:unnamed protein product [Periconia digitata]|uniref:HTH APSES-type domain-containing protein n=1 Tax=Periconia digitata TaxID=1303443 RepID=A0A9W4U726_9PLEO|nr:unnamed protein product [Periconia digitata]